MDREIRVRYWQRLERLIDQYAPRQYPNGIDAIEAWSSSLPVSDSNAAASDPEPPISSALRSIEGILLMFRAAEQRADQGKLAAVLLRIATSPLLPDVLSAGRRMLGSIKQACKIVFSSYCRWLQDVSRLPDWMEIQDYQLPWMSALPVANLCLVLQHLECGRGDPWIAASSNIAEDLIYLANTAHPTGVNLEFQLVGVAIRRRAGQLCKRLTTYSLHGLPTADDGLPTAEALSNASQSAFDATRDVVHYMGNFFIASRALYDAGTGRGKEEGAVALIEGSQALIRDDLDNFRFASLADLEVPRKTCWEVLGLSEDATVQEVKREYKRQSRSAHPDKGGCREEFQELQDAYDEALRVLGVGHAPPGVSDDVVQTAEQDLQRLLATQVLQNATKAQDATELERAISQATAAGVAPEAIHAGRLKIRMLQAADAVKGAMRGDDQAILQRALSDAVDAGVPGGPGSLIEEGTLALRRFAAVQELRIVQAAEARKFGEILHALEDSVPDSPAFLKHVAMVKMNSATVDDVHLFVSLTRDPQKGALLELLTDLLHKWGSKDAVVDLVKDWFRRRSGKLQHVTLGEGFQKLWTLLKKIKSAGGKVAEVESFLRAFVGFDRDQYDQFLHQIKCAYSGGNARQAQAFIDAVFQTTLPSQLILDMVEVLMQGLSGVCVEHDIPDRIFDSFVEGLNVDKSERPSHGSKRQVPKFRKCLSVGCTLERNHRGMHMYEMYQTSPAKRRRVLPDVPAPDGVSSSQWKDEPLKGTWSYWSRAGYGPLTWGPSLQTKGSRPKAFSPQWTAMALMALEVPKLQQISQERHLPIRGSEELLIKRIQASNRKPGRIQPSNGKLQKGIASSRRLPCTRTGKWMRAHVYTHNELFELIVEFAVGEYPDMFYKKA